MREGNSLLASSPGSFQYCMLQTACMYVTLRNGPGPGDEANSMGDLMISIAFAGA